MEQVTVSGGAMNQGSTGMAQSEITCPKCKKEMQEGFAIDNSHAHLIVGRWIEGRPESGWLGLKLRGKKWLPIATYRCLSCGYLERYAK